MSQSALKEKNFAIYMAGHLVSLHGLWIQRVAQGWLAWELSHSEFWVGLIAFAQFVPIVIFGPLFGVLADRADRKKAAIVVNFLAMVAAGALASLTVLDLIDIRLLAALALLQGLAQAAQAPIRLALVPNLVPPGQLQSALAINAVAFNFSQFAGPALSGIIIATLGVSSAFFVNCATYVASIVTLFFVTVDGEPAPKTQRRSIANEFMSGMRYAWNHESTRTFLGLSIVMAFFGRGILELLPAMADVMFGRGSNGLAALTAAVGAGALIASAYMSRGHIRHMRRIAAGGVLAALALTVALSFTSNIVPGLLIVACIGMALSFSGVSLQTLIQSTLDDRYRGRVMSLWTVVVFGGIAAGGLAIGTVAQLTNLTVATFGAGAIGLLIATAIVYYIFASGKTRPTSMTKPSLADAEDPLL